jgi:LysM repeat protein
MRAGVFARRRVVVLALCALGLVSLMMLAEGEPLRVRAQDTFTVTLSATADVPTPTPGLAAIPRNKLLPDGSLAHLVQADDTLFTIALEYGVTVEQIMQLNHLSPGDYVRVGQELIVQGPSPAATPLVMPSPSAQALAATPRPTPSPTPSGPSGLCVQAFHDRNGNGLYDGNEELVAQVRFVVLSGENQVAAHTTDGVSEPKCLANLTPGAYTVRVELPPGYEPTAVGQIGVALAPGQTASIAYGVRPKVSRPAPPVNPAQSMIARYGGIAGVILCVAGLAGLIIFQRKRKGARCE